MALNSLGKRFWIKLQTWREVRIQRIILSGLSDNMLKDIGISRGDANREARLPFWNITDNQDPTLRQRVLIKEDPKFKRC